jgi:hypothetical protein
MLPLWAALVAACFPCAEARASWWAQEQATGGSSSYFGNDFKAAVDAGNGFGFLAGHSLYTNSSLPGLVQSFSAGGSWLRQKQILSLQADIYPERFGSETEAVTLTSNWLVNEEEESHTQALLGFSYARQRAPLVFAADSGVRSVGQYALQTTIQQTYFSVFQFLAGGSFFAYDRKFDDVTANGTTFNSADLAWMTVLRPVTPFAHWSASLEFVRRPPGGELVTPFLGYTHIDFAAPAGHAESAIAGIDWTASHSVRIDLTYNYYNPSNSGAQNYVAGLIRYSP